MYVNPGELKKRIEIIQTVSVGQDSDGFPAPSEKKVVRKCFAKVTNTSGGEIARANSEFSEAKKRFMIRYSDAEINTDMTVRYKGKEYEIKYVNPYGEGKEYLEIWTNLTERA